MRVRAISLALVLFACAPQVVDAVDDAPSANAGASAGGTSGGAEIAGTGGDSAGASESTEAGAAGEGGTSSEATLRGDALIHRYSFEGTGTIAFDAKGAAHGTIIGTELTNQGYLSLDGKATTAQYVDLPDQLISGLADATFEAWITWQGGDVWQRVFDFGDDSSMLEDMRSVGRSYLFLSPFGGSDFMRSVYKNADIKEVIVNAEPAITVDVATHLAVVFDDTHDLMSLYVDGVLASATATTGHLSQIHDINDWLGRSQFSSDAPYNGSIDEFRIYEIALSAAEIQKSAAAGPDAVFPQP